MHPTPFSDLDTSMFTGTETELGREWDKKWCTELLRKSRIWVKRKGEYRWVESG